MKPSVALINDTSLFQDHFGCNLVGQTFREQFARVGLDLRYTLPRDYDLESIGNLLEEVDLVVVNGEGSIHHSRRNHLLDIASRFPAVLVNAVYQCNPRNDALGQFLYRSTRESLSASEIQSAGYDCHVTPDVIFASSQLRSFVKPLPTAGLGITDSVLKRRIRFGPVNLRKTSYGFGPSGNVADYLRCLTRHKRLCIGRFHAVVAASVLEIPFSCWESNSWKISGMMKDMGTSQYFFPEFEDALLHVPKSFDPKIREFAHGAVPRVEQMFDRIAELARDQMSQVCSSRPQSPVSEKR